MPNEPRQTKDHNFNVLVTREQWAQLTELATRAGFSRGLIIRTLITAAFQHKCQGIPTCANGRLCPVPHIHQPQTQTTGAQPREI